MAITFIKKIAASALLFTGLQAGAQSRVITFGPSRSAESSSFDVGKNSITLGIGSWINGYTSVYYERYLTDFMSIQGGLGITYRSYMNDLGTAVWQDGGDDKNSSTYDILDHYEDYSYRSTVPGYYLSIAPKFYPQDESMDGIYVMPMLEYKRYNYKAKKADLSVNPDFFSDQEDKDVPHSNDYQAEYMNCLDFTSNIGGHYQTGGHVAIDWNLGFGFRKLTAQRLDMGMTTDGSNYSYVNSVHKFTAIRPLMTINFAIGGWF